jgi:hypothetical protein
MSTDEATALVGAPDEIQHRTCGVTTDNPWPCVVWVFRLAGGYTNLLVFADAAQGSYLDGWHLGHILPSAAEQGAEAGERGIGDV